jgi:hypothetical protein
VLEKFCQQRRPLRSERIARPAPGKARPRPAAVTVPAGAAERP